jgi:hypothetical protein
MNTVSVPSVSSAHAVEIFDLFDKNFKIRFTDFRSHAASILVSILENSFSAGVSDAPEKLKLELTELQ